MNFQLLYFLAALIGAGGYTLWLSFATWNKIRVLQNTPTSRVRSAAQGFVELSGRALPQINTELKAPLTGMPCVWWRFKVEDRNGSGKSVNWSIVHKDTSAMPFVLDDGTGQCLIDPEGADVYPAETSIWYGDSDWPELRIPNGTGLFDSVVDGIFSGRYRYTEYRLMQDKPIVAIGSYHSRGGASIENPDIAVAALLREWKADQDQLLSRFDINRDGVLSADEWEMARTAARQYVNEDQTAESQTAGVSILCKPADGRPFVLAASDPSALLKQLYQKASISFIAFLATVAAMAWLLEHIE